MIRLLIILFTLSALGILGAWIAENPGNVTMHWFDYRIDTTISVMGLLFILGGIILAWIYLILRALITLPKSFSEKRTLRSYRKGLDELTQSVVALASADAKTASIHTIKAEKYLGKSPITLLLSAQVSRLQGDDVHTQHLLEEMLEHKQTEYIAARYLSETATANNQLTKARELAARAQKSSTQGTKQLLSLHIQLGEWQQAVLLLQKSLRSGSITRSELRNYQAVLYTQQSQAMLDTQNTEAAIENAKRAVKIDPQSSAAYVAYMTALLHNGKDALARKLLLKRWKQEPSVLYETLIQKATATLPKEKAIKYLQKLRSLKPDAYASHICIAHVAVSRGDWHVAREALKKALANSETAQACKLMAEVEKGEFADYDAAAHWLTRSTEATAAPEWICDNCGRASKQWQAHCPKCHSFDTLKWRQRDMAYIAPINS